MGKYPVPVETAMARMLQYSIQLKEYLKKYGEQV